MVCIEASSTMPRPQHDFVEHCVPVLAAALHGRVSPTLSGYTPISAWPPFCNEYLLREMRQQLSGLTIRCSARAVHPHVTIHIATWNGRPLMVPTPR